MLIMQQMQIALCQLAITNTLEHYFRTIKVRLSLLYSSDSTADFVLPDVMARWEASILNEFMAFFSQAPYDSATRGIQHHPKALHLGSFSVCLRSSVDNAAATADNPATDTILGFSGDVTEISKADGLPKAQLGSKMSAGRECHGLK